MAINAFRNALEFEPDNIWVQQVLYELGITLVDITVNKQYVSEMALNSGEIELLKPRSQVAQHSSIQGLRLLRDIKSESYFTILFM